MTSKYALAGVDFEKEHSVVEVMQRVGRETLRFVEDLEKVGITFPEEGNDFSGGFQLNLEKLLDCGVKKIVSEMCVDGPGSKPVAHAMYDGDDPVKLGCTAIDSIAMVVNDLICSGARPFAIAEYHSWHNINEKVAKQMAQGKLIAAELSGAAIIGGENASLPAMITGPELDKAYDMCNIALGAVIDQNLIKKPLGKERVEQGDVVIGLSSSGVHCNGITLLWKTAIDYDENSKTIEYGSGYVDRDKINEKVDSLGESVVEAILTPTIIYVKPVLQIIEEYGNGVKAIANITGEGVHNIKRVLPRAMGLNLDYSKEQVQKPHPIFRWVQEKAEIDIQEMYEDYNMGTGMVMVVNHGCADSLVDRLNQLGNEQKYDWQRFKAYRLGDVTNDKQKETWLRSFDGEDLTY